MEVRFVVRYHGRESDTRWCFWSFGNVLFLDHGGHFMNICFVINHGVVHFGFVYFKNKSYFVVSTPNPLVFEHT